VAWTTDVDLEHGIFADELVDGHGTPTLDRLPPRDFQRLNVEFSCWRLSQLLHGEEGAMLACSQLVDMVPGNDAKFFQATQVVDEARHAEVLRRSSTTSWVRANGSSKRSACNCWPRRLPCRCSGC
jgi:hypothetical protein